ncbi:unnamed protein product [Phytophthora fragariaefolia]|uniref:Unnamed protein product n=1 Tax=Phytophthora fragariaefolia TaxID=1490495 RepID=A0A9W6YHK9_9STRA|nr:unnamed protein product [Phytophthora fragariaefolia]
MMVDYARKAAAQCGPAAALASAVALGDGGADGAVPAAAAQAPGAGGAHGHREWRVGPGGHGVWRCVLRLKAESWGGERNSRVESRKVDQSGCDAYFGVAWGYFAADNKHFTLHVNGKEYPAKIGALSGVLVVVSGGGGLETLTPACLLTVWGGGCSAVAVHSGDPQDLRRQLLLQKWRDRAGAGMRGLVKRGTGGGAESAVDCGSYEEDNPVPGTACLGWLWDMLGGSLISSLYCAIQKGDVARVEEDLVKIIAGGAIEDVHEELVDFYEWMTDDEHPNGIIVTDELELIREHPEYLTLSDEQPTKKQKLLPPSAGNSTVPGTANASIMNTPLATDAGSEAESQTDGRASVQRSPVFAPTPSPRLSPMQLHSSNHDQDDDKDVDLLEDDILDGMETKPAEPPRQKEYLTDPDYLKLLPIRERLQKSVRDAERDISELNAKVDANSNIIVKVSIVSRLCCHCTSAHGILSSYLFRIVSNKCSRQRPSSVPRSQMNWTRSRRRSLLSSRVESAAPSVCSNPADSWLLPCACTRVEEEGLSTNFKYVDSGLGSKSSPNVCLFRQNTQKAYPA